MIWAPALHIIFIVMANLAVGMITFLVVTLYSNWYFGLATGIFAFLTVLNSIKVREISLAPVFPGKGWSIFFLFLLIGSSLFYGIFGERDLKNYFGDLKITKAQKAKEKTIRMISAGRVFYVKSEEWDWLLNETKGSFLGEEDTTKDGRTIFKFRLEGKNAGVYDGPAVWVPLDIIGKASSDKKDPPPNSQTSSSNSRNNWEEVKGWFGSNSAGSTGVVVLSPEDIRKQDIHKSSTRTEIVFTEFCKGDWVEVVEDFSWQVAGNNPSTVIWVGANQRLGEIKGSRVVIEKDFRFVFKDKHVSLLLNSSGDQGGFSELKLKKIKNLL